MQIEKHLILTAVTVCILFQQGQAYFYCKVNTTESGEQNPLNLPICNDSVVHVGAVQSYNNKLITTTFHEEFVITDPNTTYSIAMFNNSIIGSSGRPICVHEFLGGSLECERECVYASHFNVTTNLGCRGDDNDNTTHTYCFDAGNIDVMPDCNVLGNCVCSVEEVDDFRYFLVNQVKINVENLTNVFYKIKYPTLPEDHILHLRDIQNHDVVVNVEDNEVFITVKPMASFHVVVRKGEFSTLKSIDNNTLLAFYLPVEVMHVSGDMHVDVYISTEEYSFIIPIVGVSVCRFKDCLICWDSVSHFKCLPTTHKVAVIFIIILIFMLSLVALPYLAWILYYLFCFLWWPIKWFFRTRFCMKSRFFKMASNKVSKMKQSAQYYMDEVQDNQQYTELEEVKEDNSPVEENPIERIKRLEKKLPKTKPRGAPKMLFAIMLFAFLPKVLSCDSNDVMIASMTNCVDTSNGQICTATTAFNTILKFVKSTTCLDIKDNLSGKVVGRMELFYRQHERRLSLARQYYTTGWTMGVKSHHQCYDSGHCTDSGCKGVGANDRTAGGTFGDAWINWPGQSSCRRSCGCATCGCFLCESSCVFDAYGIVPSGMVCAVDSVIEVEETPVVDYTIFYSDGTNQTGTITFETGIGIDSSAGPTVDMQMVSEFTTSSAEFGTNSFIRCNSDAYFQFASPKNDPQSEVPGDIQADSPVRFSLPAGNAFLYNEELVTKNNQDKSTTFVIKGQGINTLASKNKLPLQVASTLWRIDDDKIHGIYLGTGGVTISGTITGSFSLYRTSDQVCPTMSLVNSTGCRNCAEGYTLYLKGKSSCHSGIVSISATDTTIFTTSMFISTDENIYKIKGSTTKEDNDFDLIIDGGNGKKDIIKVDFRAIESVDLRDDEHSQIDGSVNDTDSDGWFDSAGSFFGNLGDSIVDALENSFKGVGHWWQYLITFIIAGIAVIAFVCLLPYTLPLITQAIGKAREVSRKLKKQ